MLSASTAIAQDRFAKEVKTLQRTYAAQKISENNHIVFTGSSSIRFWPDLQKVFNNPLIVNTGFGGSQASDLLHYHQELILDFKPSKVFIYEGDNDIAFNKKPKKILRTLKKITRKIKQQNKDTKIVLIAAKPSISRWNLKSEYLDLNARLEKWALRKEQIEFANVWEVMTTNGALQQDIFIKDGLHMNAKGYALWEKVIKNFL